MNVKCTEGLLRDSLRSSRSQKILSKCRRRSCAPGHGELRFDSHDVSRGIQIRQSSWTSRVELELLVLPLMRAWVGWMCWKHNIIKRIRNQMNRGKKRSSASYGSFSLRAAAHRWMLHCVLSHVGCSYSMSGNTAVPLPRIKDGKPPVQFSTNWSC